MEYNIYCDESCHLRRDKNNIMVLGGVYCGIDDYVIILKDEGKSYRFITAFPVVSKKKKTEYEAQYCRFIKKSRESNEPQQTPST